MLLYASQLLTLLTLTFLLAYTCESHSHTLPHIYISQALPYFLAP